MIIVITGQPGNGKTLRAMALMREEYERNAQAAKEGREEPRRFFTNIIGATIQENPNAFPWVERLPEHNDWTKLPHGSYVVYDEAHSDGVTPGLERYGLLFPATGKPGESNDPRIRAMSTHRSSFSMDIVLITQWPNKIHHQVRTLAGRHIHMNRAMGLQRAGTFSWTRVQPDPYDETQREKAEEEIWAYEVDLYIRYKSATIHTATYKFKVPKKVWVGVSRLVVTVVVGWCLWLFIFKPEAKESDEQVDKPNNAAIALAPAGAGGPRSASRPSDPLEYLKDFAPRIPQAPWTAPAYDGREVVAKPALYCMASDPGQDANGRERRQSCTCLTEQGTRYTIRNVDCRGLARNGPAYNPFQEPQEPRYQAMAQPGVEAQASPVKSVPALAGAVVAGDPGAVVGAGIRDVSQD